jgi:hypothetical protein
MIDGLLSSYSAVQYSSSFSGLAIDRYDIQ